MKASIYSILVGVWVFLVAAVLIPAPMAFLTAVQDIADNRSLVHFVVATWIVFSILVLARPPASESIEEFVVRGIAWLVIFKCLSFLCWPGLLTWSLERLNEFPNLVRCIGLIDVLVGSWMFYIARKLTSSASRDSTSENA